MHRNTILPPQQLIERQRQMQFYWINECYQWFLIFIFWKFPLHTKCVELYLLILYECFVINIFKSLSCFPYSGGDRPKYIFNCFQVHKRIKRLNFQTLYFNMYFMLIQAKWIHKYLSINLSTCHTNFKSSLEWYW